MSGLVKVQLKGENGTTVTAKFNPNQLSLSRSVNWNPQAGNEQQSKAVQHTHSEPRNLGFELLFDAFESGPGGSVAGQIDGLMSFTKMHDESHAPPIVDFIWGQFLPEGSVFRGVFQSVSVTYTMFQPSGAPCRAKANCTMIEYIPMEQQQKGTPTQSPDHAKLRVVRRGDTLQSIAASEYDDASEWRRIADVNSIDNPLDLAPGMSLLVPPILPK